MPRSPSAEAYSRLGGNVDWHTMLPQGSSPERKAMHLVSEPTYHYWELHLGPDCLQGEDLIGWNWVFSGFPGGVSGKETNAGDARDAGLISGSGRFPWRRAWQPTPVILPGESFDQGAWWATVHSIVKSRKQQKRLSVHT